MSEKAAVSEKAALMLVMLVLELVFVEDDLLEGPELCGSAPRAQPVVFLLPSIGIVEGDLNLARSGGDPNLKSNAKLGRHTRHTHWDVV